MSVTAAKQVALNWTKILSKCSPTVRKTVLDARSQHEDLSRQIHEIKQSLPKLDFAAYRQNLPKEMGKIVDQAEKEFKNFKVNKVDVTSSLKELDEERDLKMKLSREFVISLNDKVEKLKTHLNKLENSKSVDELTVEDVYEINPGLREKIYQSIRDDEWGTGSGKERELKGNIVDGKRDKMVEGEKLNYL